MNELTRQDERIEAFIDRWRRSGAAERANYALFLSELCDLLDVPRPEPKAPEPDQNRYVFEKTVTIRHSDGSTNLGRIDLYKRGCFVLEAKQGSQPDEKDGSDLLRASTGRRRTGTAVRGTKGWDQAMVRAKAQAEQYARGLEEWPPFILVVDVGHMIELYSDFDRMGKVYLPFPEPLNHRIRLDDLRDPAIRERLRRVWTDPESLDPSAYATKVTRQVTARLALLARSLEDAGNDPEMVAHFLMRCLFTFFAEDVGLLPGDCFTRLFERYSDKPEKLTPMISILWRDMNKGSRFSAVAEDAVAWFNGRFFSNPTVITLNVDQIALLLEAGKFDWSQVEPTIFGTLLERALDPRERHKLGAHYTPRAYVERLVIHTVIEPLREEWESAKAAAMTQLKAAGEDGKAIDGPNGEAIKILTDFHRRLCDIRVLDPACGTGNFLYVTLEHMRRIEGEVIQLLRDLDDYQAKLEFEGHSVNPSQFLGLEINPRAQAIAELVLWLGHLQWHFRTRGRVELPEPVMKDFRNIRNLDAVLAYDRLESARDEEGNAITRWDGVSMKTHPVTGKQVPDESRTVILKKYAKPSRAEWPEADFVVGNPPFVGNWRMRELLGIGYAEALRATYDDVPESSDYVMYWWAQAARRMRRPDQKSRRRLRRFGFITTNSITQTYSRRVMQPHLDAKDGISLLFAIPDHPWVDADEGADVRIAMTVAAPGPGLEGDLWRVTAESRGDGDARAVEFEKTRGKIHSNLTIGVDITRIVPLMANEGLSSRGVSLHGKGFIVTPDEAKALGLGRVPGLENHIRPYRNGRDINQRSRDVMVIDLFGLSADEVRERFPEVFQHVHDHVKPLRDQNNRRTYRDNWWIFGEPRANLRPALEGLNRYIATVETSRHRFFVFLDHIILPDNKLVNIAVDDAFFLGVLSSNLHVAWSLRAGGRLGVGNDPVYVKSRCFDPFPFPDCDEAAKAKIRALAEELDALRKARQEAYPRLTLTGIYNVLDKLRTGEELSAKERIIHDQGVCGTVLELHQAIDREVAAAYGWPEQMEDEEILRRLVELNGERAEEEARGRIRWLRPAFQRPQAPEVQMAFDGVPLAATAESKAIRRDKLVWPKTLLDRVQALRGMLTADPQPATLKQIARRFHRAREDKVEEILEAMASLGQARKFDDGRFAG